MVQPRLGGFSGLGRTGLPAHLFSQTINSRINAAKVRKRFVYATRSFLRDQLFNFCILFIPDKMELIKYPLVAHLSNQFKKVAALTPIFYERLKDKRIQNMEGL